MMLFMVRNGVSGSMARWMEDILIIPVIKRFGMTAYINNGGCKINTGKYGAVIGMV